MGAGYFYAAIIAIAVLNINIVSTLKNVKKEQDTSLNTVIGSIQSTSIHQPSLARFMNILSAKRYMTFKSNKVYAYELDFSIQNTE